MICDGLWFLLYICVLINLSKDKFICFIPNNIITCGSLNMEIQPTIILRNPDIHRFIELFQDTMRSSTNPANGVSNI